MSYGTANSKIKDMLEDCGECRVGDEVVEDFKRLNEKSIYEFGYSKIKNSLEEAGFTLEDDL